EPSHTLQQLPRLIAASGIDADVAVETEVAELSPLVSREAYRIVQESLTNALRYGADRAAKVRITMPDDRLRVLVSNPIAVTAGPAREGRGIVGMRERVEVLGGSLTAGPADGRWVVDAVLPVRSQP
ncbi:MAG: sensor histidine kinase, partial [Stackebrandtia sp.]